MNSPRPPIPHVATMKLRITLLVACSIVLFPFLYAMAFTFPLGDDFPRALLANGLFDLRGAVLDSARSWFFWSGRYTHHFLVVFLGDAALNRPAYTAVLLVVFLSYGGALYGILSSIARDLPPSLRLLFALAGLVALACGHRALGGTYYLLTDALGIGIGNAAVLWFVFALCRLWHCAGTETRDTGLAVGAAVFAIGCYEHAALATLCAATAALWMAYRSGHPARRRFLLVFGASLTCFFFSFLAPGNFRRQRLRGVSSVSMLEQLLAMNHTFVVAALPAFTGLPALLSVLAGVIVSPTRHPLTESIPRLQMALAGCLVFLCMAVGIIAIHAASDVPLTSVQKLVASLQLLLALPISFLCISLLGPLRTRLAAVRVELLLMPVLLAAMASQNLHGTAHGIVSGGFEKYKCFSLLRMKTLQQGTGEDVRVAPLGLCPFPACVGDPIPVAADIWPGKDIATLFGLRSIAAEPFSAGAAFELARTTARTGEPQWHPLSGTELAVWLPPHVVPGPNPTYADFWLFLRSPVPLPQTELRVLAAPSPPNGRFAKAIHRLLADTAGLPDARHPTPEDRALGMMRIRILSGPPHTLRGEAGQEYAIYGMPLAVGAKTSLHRIFVAVGQGDFMEATGPMPSR
nr:hypothetical protein RVX_2046 [Nitratidesulfovibrio sp. HK-II]